MIPDLKNISKADLFRWLKEEAGVNNGEYFSAKEGGLELQQIPEEYVEYLWILKTGRFKSYLNIGIGNGGSFLLETLIQPELEISYAVDNLSYGTHTNRVKVSEVFDILELETSSDVRFWEQNSSEFFKHNTLTFDVIFIDGDHSYEGVLEDFQNALTVLNPEGCIILHDINSYQCPGVVKLWQEIKNENCIEFIHGSKCGIGVWRK